MKSVSLAAVAMLATLVPCAPATAGFSSIYTFGDSVSDTGNVFAATGTPGAPYFNGRFSNGPVWVEVLANRLGVASPTPSLTGGTNFAWGGAQTGTGLSPLGTPNLGTQVGGFVAGGGSLTAANLVTITAGGNDFLGGVTNPIAPVDNIAAAITGLAGAGGRSFLVANLPKLGQIPGSAPLPQPQRDALDAVTVAFNGLLSARIAQLRTLLGVDIWVLDLDGLIQEVRANPSGFGFTNTTGSALGDGVVSGQGYLFWDNVHVTAPGHQLIGNRASTLVPEPSSATLLAAAAAAALAVPALRRRRTAA